RLEIERWVEKNQKLWEEGQFDGPRQGEYAFLAVDAFSSDAIPVHLITKEAVALFMKLVREDGVLTYHISNRYLKLDPVLANIARELGLAVAIEKDDDYTYDLETVGKTTSTWVVLARKEEYLRPLMTKDRWDAERKATQKQLLPLTTLPNAGGGLSSYAFA